MIIYRTAGAWGSGKGADLVADEIDGNFYDLVQQIAASAGEDGNGIANIIQEGSNLTIIMDDATTFGPFPLPRPTQRPTVTLAVTGTALTPLASQASYYFRCTNPLGCEVVVPTNGSVPHLIDTELHFRQCADVSTDGDGTILFTAGSDTDETVVINPVKGMIHATFGVGSVVTLKKVGTNEWDIFGDLAEDVTA